MDIRCLAKKFGELHDGLWEVKCNSDRCGAAPGVVVIHRFDPLTGDLVGTWRFRDPEPEAMKEGSAHATNDNPVAVRAP